jgi:beta-glucanase (GH16 family)
MDIFIHCVAKLLPAGDISKFFSPIHPLTALIVIFLLNFHLNSFCMKTIATILLLFITINGLYAQPFNKLVWADEFNYNGLPDSTKWSYDVGGHGWGNAELEYYTHKRLKNARVSNGMLIIEAIKEKIEGMNYSSARLVTKGKGDWTYGRIEVRAKIPSGIGTWPAIWMLASTTPLHWPDDGEIDIMEHVGYDPGNIHYSVHTKAYNHVQHTQKTDSSIVKDYDTQFHVYGLIWTKEKITITVDQKPQFTFTNEHKTSAEWPFNKPFHLLLNIAIGGFWGGQKGVDDTIFPNRMLVDYVRVYQ